MLWSIQPWNMLLVALTWFHLPHISCLISKWTKAASGFKYWSLISTFTMAEYHSHWSSLAVGQWGSQFQEWSALICVAGDLLSFTEVSFNRSLGRMAKGLIWKAWYDNGYTKEKHVILFYTHGDTRWLLASWQGDCCCVRIPTCQRWKDKQSNVEQGVSPPATVRTLNGHLCSQAAA